MNAGRHFLKRHTGFTLIELMIVLAVIAILAAIAIPNFKGVQRDNALYSEAQRIRTEIKYMQQAAYEAENAATMDFAENHCTVKLNGSVIKIIDLENNVQFGSTQPLIIAKDGLPDPAYSYPVTIILVRQYSSIYIKVDSGGKVNISWS